MYYQVFLMVLSCRLELKCSKVKVLCQGIVLVKVKTLTSINEKRVGPSRGTLLASRDSRFLILLPWSLVLGVKLMNNYEVG